MMFEYDRFSLRTVEKMIAYYKRGGILDARIIIYPFGLYGKVAKSILNVNFGIKEYAVADGLLSKECDGIYSLEDINKEENKKDIVVLIATDKKKTYEDLHSAIYEVIPENQCYDLLPEFHGGKPTLWEPYANEMPLYGEVWKQARYDSAIYINEHMSNVTIFENRWDLLKSTILDHIEIDNGLLLEFGVFRGESINYLAALRSLEKIHGFDSFEGLPVDWRSDSKKGEFTLNGKLPRVRKNVVLHKGWFDETLPEFAGAHSEKCSFIHIDSDVYISAKIIFDNLADHITKGTVIVFDEYFNRPGWRNNEYKAWQEFVEKSGIKYKYIGYVAGNYESCQVAVKVMGKER